MISKKNYISSKDESINKPYYLLFSTIAKICLFSLIIGFVLRLALVLTENTEVGFTFGEWFKIFFLGAFNDLCFAVIASVFIWFDLLFVSKSKYRKPWGYILWVFILIALVYVSFFNTVFHEYGSAVPRIVQMLLLYKSISFGIRLFVPSIRMKWSFAVYVVLIFLYVANILLFVPIGEYLFWDEFGVRYNFIAVDYLIYTNEVIGNIMESYPVVPLLIGLAIISGIVTYLMVNDTKRYFDLALTLKQKVVSSIGYLALIGLACIVIKFNTRFQDSENIYANELQANGSFKFYNAFMNSSLEFRDFYTLLPKQDAIDIVNLQCGSVGINNSRLISDSLPEIHKNIVLITVESLSASFMTYFGNTENITPNLDTLANHSLFFTNLFATGNRTVRGLEAVTLSRPPCSGESIVKQPNNSNLFSTAKVLKDKGYIVQFLYGGDSYFDNMGTFFGGNSYEIIDKKDFLKNEITFSNIWGVCDEDMYNKAINIFDHNVKTKKPFFGHIMTTSNHRPYTYPKGKIDIPTDSKSRAGGVKYSDYALGQFLHDAKSKPWFKNTVFVIVADHCASSAGKTSIPLEGYYIPALVYAPGFVAPKQEDRIVSQIDLIPTLFGMLNFSYESNFFGQDINEASYHERAFIATYQNLGYLKDNILTVLSPVKKIEQFRITKTENHKYDMSPLYDVDSTLVKETIANYQMTSYQ